MFKKILVANRGEIACRVFRTARKMGIATVAVYSDADRNALHTQMADEAVRIGAAPSAESYLVIERILEACRQTGADAVHPGYGFLSENAEFVSKLTEAGISFIGPGTRAIEAMGDKIESKKIANTAGVNTIPGFTGVLQGADHAVELAREIGYPVMLKASAGGGGKGMRIAYDDSECAEGFERASNESRSSFGDDRVFVEKYIEKPRHIEIQVIADGQGKTLYLGERECSIQRRHQKVLEEAPSPFVTPDMRVSMGQQAVQLAEAVGYESAGTVEFIVDAQRNFYFLEMNTRLQVEHPVTEMVTGLDLVQMMIEIAAGQPIRMDQQDVELDGWAMEARVYAEDPVRGFLPSIGRLVEYVAPEGASVRVDSGVMEGGEVAVYYDPMIAKLVTHASSRDECIQVMRNALNRFHISGVANNIGFLNALVTHPRYIDGALTTNFIDEEYPEGYLPSIPEGDTLRIFLLAAMVADSVRSMRSTSSRDQLGVTQPAAVQQRERVVLINGAHHLARIEIGPQATRIEIDGEAHDVDYQWRPGKVLMLLRTGGREYWLRLMPEAMGYRLIHDGYDAGVTVLSPFAAEMSRYMPERVAADQSKFLLSPMPGLLVKLSVSVGDSVEEGEELAVIEAMKMENVLRASRDGIIKSVLAEEGGSLIVDQPILEFE